LNEREFTTRVRRRGRAAHLAIDADLAARLWKYVELLVRWNAKINLTSLSLDSAPDAAIDRLIVEPLLAARHLPAAPHTIDIGSGGGSPAIPMLLACRGMRLVMVESKARKSAFLREAVRHLDLTATVETARFEELLSRAEFHETFDVLTLRAVRTEPRTLMTLQAFVRAGGRILLFKAGSPVTAPAAVPPLRVASQHTLGQNSTLLVLEKLSIP
jgi:16S rRNA (guanine527-N7)-methyltransferase